MSLMAFAFQTWLIYYDYYAWWKFYVLIFNADFDVAEKKVYTHHRTRTHKHKISNANMTMNTNTPARFTGLPGEKVWDKKNEFFSGTKCYLSFRWIWFSSSFLFLTSLHDSSFIGFAKMFPYTFNNERNGLANDIRSYNMPFIVYCTGIKCPFVTLLFCIYFDSSREEKQQQQQPTTTTALLKHFEMVHIK